MNGTAFEALRVRLVAALAADLGSVEGPPPPDLSFADALGRCRSAFRLYMGARIEIVDEIGVCICRCLLAGRVIAVAGNGSRDYAEGCALVAGLEAMSTATARPDFSSLS